MVIQKTVNLNQDTQKTTVKINKNNPLAAQDYALIIDSYEKKSGRINTEEAALASTYKDVYSTRNFSSRAQEQMEYYPGMHQTSTSQPKENPAYKIPQESAEDRMQDWNTSLDNPYMFMDSLRNNSQDIDYTQIFGSDVDAKTRAENLGKILTECVPCFDRLLDVNGLLPSGELLSVYKTNLNARKDLLKQIKDIFTLPNYYIDVCEMLNLLAKMCPSDLIAMQMLLSNYLAKINLEVEFNIDFIINLVGPILSPFLNAMSQWIDKWIQLIIGPMNCVIDHINETIIMTQQAKIPFSDANIDIDADLGILSGGLKKSEEDGIAWSQDEFKRLEESDKAKYSNYPPEWPEEEIELSKQEMIDSFGDTPSKVEQEVKRKKFQELKAKKKQKKTTPKQPINREKYHPPEKQTFVKDSNYYLDISPLTNSIVQLRNILQASVQYSNDWFEHITQMIYDLLGTDIGWMQKKTGTTYIKSEIIQLLLLIKGILEARSKNGLECGSNTNFDVGQMKYVFENTLNEQSSANFEVLDNGEIKITSKVPTPIGSDNSSNGGPIQTPTSVNIGDDFKSINIPTSSAEKQKSIKSGIIIKNCLKDLSIDKLEEVRSWIAEYEKQS